MSRQVGSKLEAYKATVEITREKLIDQCMRSISIARLMKDCDEIVDIVLRKNHDYGDAWQRYGAFTALIRINDKLLRLQTLESGETALVPDESIKDTLRDTIGYAMLCLQWLEENA